MLIAKLKALIGHAKKHKLHLFLGALSIAGVTVSAVQTVRLHEKAQDNQRLYAKNTELGVELEQKNKEIDTLKSTNVSLSSDLKFSQDYADVLYGLGTFIEEKLDAMNAILLETDHNSLQFIDWLTDNGYFKEAYSGETSYRYGQWRAVQSKTDRDYNALQDEIQEMTDQVDAIFSGNSSSSQVN